MKKIFMMLVMTGFMTACNKPTAPENAATPSAAVPTTPAPETKPQDAPAPEATAPATDDMERIQLAKGASDTDLDIVLDARETKKFVAFVAKGYMTCIMPNADLGSKITVKVDGKTRNLAEDGPCGEHATKAGDQVIEFINNGNKEFPFVANVSFNEHM